tara:strand:- start:204 stop:437 length:234 start_codon:yes stop_codon:yes gene_type:complete
LKEVLVDGVIQEWRLRQKVLLIIFTVEEALKIIETKRYIDSDGLTPEVEEELAQVRGMTVDYFPNNERCYTLYANSF